MRHCCTFFLSGFLPAEALDGFSAFALGASDGESTEAKKSSGGAATALLASCNQDVPPQTRRPDAVRISATVSPGSQLRKQRIRSQPSAVWWHRPTHRIGLGSRLRSCGGESPRFGEKLLRALLALLTLGRCPSSASFGGWLFLRCILAWVSNCRHTRGRKRQRWCEQRNHRWI